MKSKKLTHVDVSGNPSMVDVSHKPSTLRKARALAIVNTGPEILRQIKNNEIMTKKGPVFATAIIAGVMGAKNTSLIIPFCHPLSLEDCKIHIRIRRKKIHIEAITLVTAKTGVEMEALTAASVAALTIYDMCKALSHDIVVEEIKLMEKSGGKNNFHRSGE